MSNGYCGNKNTQSDYEKCGGALWKPQILFPYCLRCGKKLKTPEAQERGYGKICWEKRLHDKQSHLF